MIGGWPVAALAGASAGADDEVLGPDGVSAPVLQAAALSSRLWAIAAHRTQAEFAPKRPEGMWASGPSIRSANTVSMTAWRRWVMSASATGSVESVKNG